MNRRTRHALKHMDDASLQTDVMRFMAIVAFCLIAILAVVRNVDAPPVQAQEPVQKANVKVAAQAPHVETTQTELVKAPELPQIDTQPPLTPPPDLIVTAAPIPESKPPAPMQPTPPAAPLTEPQKVSPQPSQAEPGLRLSFASNRDFLRLINSGAVTVHAWNTDRLLALDQSYQFNDSAAPGTYHELDSTTVPSLIRDTLKAHVSPSQVSEWRWGVVLPAHISRQIQQQVNRYEHGEIQIDQYQQVRYVAAN